MWQERLTGRLKEIGWSQAELARRSGVPYPRLRKWMSSGISHPRGEALAKIAQALKVTELWLVYGIDEAGAGQQTPLIPFDQLPEAALGSVQAQSLPSGRHAGQTRGFRTCMPDASMAPRINKGAELHCRPDEQCAPASVVLVHISESDRLVVRAMHQSSPTRVAFVPDNPAFPTYEFQLNEGYTIVARVTHVLTEL